MTLETIKVSALVFAIVVAIISGGTATVGAVKFDLPGFSIIKEFIFTKRDAHKILSELETHNVLTVVYQKSKEELRSDAELMFVSQAAAKFYGYEQPNALVGMTAKELTEILLPLLENGEEFSVDQERVQLDMKNKKKPVATVPMKIRDDHPYPEYRGKTYHPVIVHTATQKNRDGTAEDFITVLYLDLSVLPAKYITF